MNFTGHLDNRVIEQMFSRFGLFFNRTEMEMLKDHYRSDLFATRGQFNYQALVNDLTTKKPESQALTSYTRE